MTKKKSPSNSSVKPVIYVHARGHSPVSDSQVQSLRELGLPLFTRLEIEGATQTSNGYDQPAALLCELHKKHPDCPIILLRAGLQPTSDLLEQLGEIEQKTEVATVLIPLSNATPSVNPFVGLRAPAKCTEYDFPGMVGLLAPGNLHPLTELPDHFAYFTARAVERIATRSCSGSLLHQLSVAGIKPVACDHLFVHDPDNEVLADLDLKPHEHRFPPPFAELSARLQAYMDAGIKRSPLPMCKKPATLHITHSWGGGIAKWIELYIQADHDHRHFQLRSENAEARAPFGLKLSLYAGNELRCPIASWWMQPPIESTDGANAAIKEILSDICHRFGIGRVFVSSLIGHSLDALRTGLPTVQILHDHFPVWPLLGVSPEPYLSSANGADLGKALSENRRTVNFLDRNEDSWSRFNSDYLRALTESKTKIVAPGQWVLELQGKLEPGFSALESQVIPHGFPSLKYLQPVETKPRKDGRLRMVILGRMQEGKGSKLLLRALPKLAEHVQVYLLGTGKPGEAFFGLPGVNVVLEYEHAELGDLIGKIKPDFAALLSVVPETFSYTLSELQQLGIPAIATRVGSFPDRIETGQTGWLIDVNADALVEQVMALCQEPGQLETVRQNLLSIDQGTIEEMVGVYDQYCPVAKALQPFMPTTTEPAQIQRAAADYQRTLTRTELLDALEKQTLMAGWAKQEREDRKSWQKEAKRLNREFEAKAAWALELHQDLEQERSNRELWVDQLEAELGGVYSRLNQTHDKLQKTQATLQSTQATLRSESQRLEQLRSEHDSLNQQQELILNSSSWKITRPLRVTRRMLKNFMLARAWNPLRWPWLLSGLVRTLHTGGLSGTLRRIQATSAEFVEQSDTTVIPGQVEQTTLTTAEETQSERNTGDPSTALQTPVPGPFELPEKPHTSIIIPVYNQWSYTAACLASLLTAKCNYTFEVIVVDDQSNDETAEELENVEGIIYLRNQENQGFVKSCNRGARHARGEFLVLLNNDTEVTDHWLDELINTFEFEPDAGLVGSRLSYPDGRLQESGGMIFNDASGWNYGRGDDPERPEYQYLREADYCSGACIALKTEFFNALGGLDERYSPAYYEDTDLAFKVRQAGRKVLIQPFSMVIHHEGVTSGTDTSSGTKKYQLINQQKFLERWQTELESQSPPINDPYHKPSIRKACNHRNKGRVLFVDAYTPEPDQDSGSVRLTNLMQICRQLGYAVTFFADTRKYAGHYTRNLQRTGIEVWFEPWLESQAGFFRDRGNEFDYIFISRHYVARNYLQMLKRYCPDSQFIFDTVDLHYLRERRLAELKNSRSLKIAARQTRRSELNVIKAADVTLVVSATEKDVLAEDAPAEAVHVVSNIHQVPGRGKEFSGRKDIYFVGGYQHPPNIDAAKWFVNDIWPLVHEQLPDIEFHLIGSKAPDQIRQLEGDGVVFHGYVESLEPFLNGCRLAVAPLRYGAGVKGKVNMSMAHGQPVVLTSAAAEGLFGKHEREFLLADDAASFANEIVRLYQDEALWNELSDASVKNVEEHFSMAAARSSMTALFKSLKKQGQ